MFSDSWLICTTPLKIVTISISLSTSCLVVILGITLASIDDFPKSKQVRYLKFRCFIVLTGDNYVEFFIACMLLCLEYLHKNAILHRDIKPENLVFDEHGYLRITDLGIARLWNPENSKDTSGTPGYMAPEVLVSII